MRYVFLLLSCLLVFPAVANEFYKWTDAQGKVHYSDQPPPESEYQTLTGAAIPTPDQGKSSYQRAKGSHKALQKAQAAQAKQSEKAQAAARRAAIRAQNCQSANSNLQYLQSHTRILIPPENGEGEPKRMGNQERLRRIDKARAAVEKYCGPNQGTSD